MKNGIIIRLRICTWIITMTQEEKGVDQNMKRILSILLLTLVIIGFTEAAYVRAFRQRGPATHDIKSRNLVAAHPNLPMGTEVTVTNLANNISIVVIVNGRIVASGSRIIDLSEGAARALGMVGQGATSVAIEVLRDRPNTESSMSGVGPD
jgi:hypothetical protein